MQDADLYKQLNQSMAEVARISPLNDNIEEVLKTFYSFETPKVKPIVPTVVTSMCDSDVMFLLR